MGLIVKLLHRAAGQPASGAENYEKKRFCHMGRASMTANRGLVEGKSAAGKPKRSGGPGEDNMFQVDRE